MNFQLNQVPQLAPLACGGMEGMGFLEEMKLNAVLAWELNRVGVDTAKLDSTPLRQICSRAIDDYQWFPGNQVGSNISPSDGRHRAVVAVSKLIALVVLGPSSFSFAGGRADNINLDLSRVVAGLSNRNLVGLERIYADVAVILQRAGLAHSEFMAVLGSQLQDHNDKPSQVREDSNMSLFGKMFGSKQLMPPCAIHPTDAALVKREDLDWWAGVAVSDLKVVEDQENALRLAAYMQSKEEGLSGDDAARRVRLKYPYYYWKLEHRADEKVPISADDAKLPYVLMNRVQHAMATGAINRASVANTTSFNALVRQLIRSGRI